MTKVYTRMHSVTEHHWETGGTTTQVITNRSLLEAISRRSSTTSSWDSSLLRWNLTKRFVVREQAESRKKSITMIGN